MGMLGNSWVGNARVRVGGRGLGRIGRQCPRGDEDGLAVGAEARGVAGGGAGGSLGPGGQVVRFGAGWASKMCSFGNSRRRRLRRSNSSTARRYIRSVWA